MAVTQSPEYTTPPAPLEPAQPPKKRPTTLIITGAVVALVVIAAAVVAIVFAMKPKGPDPKDPKSAIPACHEEVKAKMKAPATTQFSGESVVNNGTQLEIDGAYDSQNSYGALVRGAYTCLLYHDNAGNIQVASVDIREP